MIIYVDIDNTITITNGMDYKNAIPRPDKIKIINDLYKKGHRIIYWTARGSGSGIDYTELTMKQLKKWRCKYDGLKFNKPVWDVLIDDKSLNSVHDLHE